MEKNEPQLENENCKISRRKCWRNSCAVRVGRTKLETRKVRISAHWKMSFNIWKGKLQNGRKKICGLASRTDNEHLQLIRLVQKEPRLKRLNCKNGNSFCTNLIMLRSKVAQLKVVGRSAGVLHLAQLKPDPVTNIALFLPRPQPMGTNISLFVWVWPFQISHTHGVLRWQRCEANENEDVRQLERLKGISTLESTWAVVLGQFLLFETSTCSLPAAPQHRAPGSGVQCWWRVGGGSVPGCHRCKNLTQEPKAFLRDVTGCGVGWS